VAGIGRRIGKWVLRRCAKHGDLGTSRPVGGKFAHALQFTAMRAEGKYLGLGVVLLSSGELGSITSSEVIKAIATYSGLTNLHCRDCVLHPGPSRDRNQLRQRLPQRRRAARERQCEGELREPGTHRRGRLRGIERLLGDSDERPGLYHQLYLPAHQGGCRRVYVAAGRSAAWMVPKEATRPRAPVQPNPHRQITWLSSPIHSRGVRDHPS
jgi:hypothetical protein